MERLKEIFWHTLKLFRDLELLPHLLLVGSWAEYIYEINSTNIRSPKKNKTFD